jgi:intracellular multiplication protein IcmK
MLKKRRIAVFVLMGLLCTVGLNARLCAQELSLEDFISDEPDEETLESPQDNATDSMPEVPQTRLSIRTKGFENSARESMDVDITPQDPAQKTNEELAEQIRQEAYNAALTGLFPLNSDHIRSLLHEYNETQRAVEEPLNGYPTPRVNVETVSLDPGVTPLSVKTAVGHITTINMLDITGAPWPIQDISWAGDFEVVEPEEGGNILRITPMAIAAYGNMSIRLLTLKTPVVIRLTTNTDEVQYRVDARIPEYGPFAQTPLIDSGIERVAGNKTIISVLDGVMPANAAPLTVSGVDGRTTAYEYNNTTYVRTPLTLLSPGWEQSVSSADGMNVYVLNNTPVLLLSDKGRFVRANLKPSKGLTDE